MTALLIGFILVYAPLQERRAAGRLHDDETRMKHEIIDEVRLNRERIDRNEKRLGALEATTRP